MGTIKETFGTRTNLSTFGTGFGSMIRTDLNYFDTFPFSFVFDKLLKLIEAPAIQPEVESSSFAHFSYSFKVLKNNSSCITIIHNLFAYHMIPVSHKPSLSARQLFKQSLGRPCAFGLKFATQSSIFDSFEFNLFCVEELPVACHSNIVYSDINTKNSFMDVRAFSIEVFGKAEQKETSVLLVNSQQTFIQTPFLEIFKIAIGDFNREFLPSFDSCQTQDIIFDGSRTIEVVSHTNFIYDWFGFGSLDHATSLFDTSDSQLALQSSFTQRFIDKRMKFDIVSYLPLPCLVNTELESFAVNLQSPDYLLCCINPDFCSGSNFHYIYKESKVVYKPYGCPVLLEHKYPSIQEGGNGIPPTDESAGILPNFL